MRQALQDGSLTEIEMAWSDPFGHAQGKRIPAAQFLDRALGTGFAFCEASLGWNTDGTVIDSLQLTNWGGGYPDVFAVPTSRHIGRCLGVHGSVTSSPTSSPTTAARHCWIPARCSRRCWNALPRLAYTAKIGVEFELYLLNADGSPFQADIHAYSLENANALDPLLSDLYETLSDFTRLEGIQTEYGPGQIETNLVYTDALEAADDAARLKYADQGSGPQARQDRQLHAKAVHRALRKLASTYTSRCGAMTNRPSRPDDGSENELLCMRSRACSSICRRSRCSARTPSTLTDDSPLTPSPRPP